MDKNTGNMGLEGHMAVPLHLQRLERSLNIQPFINQVNDLFQDHMSDDGMSVMSISSDDSNSYSNHVLNEKEEERINKLRLYNMDTIGEERRWLQDILLSDSSDNSQSDSENDDEITEDDFQDMLKFHILRKKYQGKFYQKPENIQYQYYGAGLLSNVDRFPDHQKLIVGNRKRKEKKSDKKTIKIKKEKMLKHHKPDACQEHDYPEEDWDKIIPKEEDLDEAELEALMKQSKSRGRKKHNTKTPEMMAIRRRKIWIMMSKKELGKIQRARTNNHKEMLIGCRKVAQHCMKYCRQKAMHSQKYMKETIWRAKRLTREMQSYWKRYDRCERETRRRLEREAEEQRKMDVELIEAKRQQRKLNFLITQTELYAHFMSKKVSKSAAEEQLRILNQLDEERNPRLVGIDDYDSEAMKQKAKRNAMEAFDSEKARTRQFDCAAAQELRLSDTGENHEHPQPSIFEGNLKGYQLKGMNWLANLYDQGISGILADEMGLGKTVQSIAFLCHIAEQYSVWGPFLIISPASTLHNWQQEMARFVPSFKVVPYWGNPQERKILRQFWDTKDLHTKEASFHVVITSYQLVITDYKYFNRIKWQYMILDEAQAIKSTSSMRWKLLLGFSCRNRLLLSGTPIQNSMAELWALLHFIMPTLFDSHDEFNEWFSKDIESHAENKTGIDEKHLSRLHMILKPFMLRRIKKDVENELSDKIEVMVYCPLTTRQKLLYSALKQKIRIEDLLYYTVGGDTSGNDKNLTSNLMNLVMQFRKVCNHPELFERRDAKSPLYLKTESYQMPALLYTEGLLETALPSRDHILYNKFFCFTVEHMQRSLMGHNGENRQRSVKIWETSTIEEMKEDDESSKVSEKSADRGNCFAFSRFIGMSPAELNLMFTSGIMFRLCHAVHLKRQLQRKKYWQDWWVDEKTPEPTNTLLLLIKTCDKIMDSHPDLFFTNRIVQGEPVYTHALYKIHAMPETMTHRILRSSKHPSNAALRFPRLPGNPKPEAGDEPKLVLLPEHRHLPRPVIVRDCQLTNFPAFLLEVHPKIQVAPRHLYVSNSAASAAWKRHMDCGGVFGKKVLKMGCEKAMMSSPEVDPTFGVEKLNKATMFSWEPPGGLEACAPVTGWSSVAIPDKQTLVTDAGKLSVLDNLLKRLKEQGHRVLIYSQMTKMIDLLEEYMYHRKHTFMRLDGSSKISDRRDMVADFQKRADIFVFLLSTRAGGLGINLTAADTVIFYDSDWNPTVDQQAMDRAHRLGQTKQVTVYRLICKGTIEERILQRAREKSEIQRMVISGGNFKPDTLKPKEVVSLLLDDEEIEAKYSQRSEERKQYAAATSSASVVEDTRTDSTIHHKEKERKRKLTALPVKVEAKRPCFDDNNGEKLNETSPVGATSEPVNQQGCDQQEGGGGGDDCGSSIKSEDETSNEGLVVDVDGPVYSGSSPRHFRTVTFSEPLKVSKLSYHSSFGNTTKIRQPIRGTSKRGRPRGSRSRGPVAGKGRGMSVQGSPVNTPGGSCDNLNQIGLYAGSIEGETQQQAPASNTLHHQLTVAAGRGLATVKRGPGRPRLRPAGPVNQGYRAPTQHYGKRIQRPLPVPLRSNQLSTTANSMANSGAGGTTTTTLVVGQVPSNSSTPPAAPASGEPRPFGFYTQQNKNQMQ